MSNNKIKKAYRSMEVIMFRGQDTDQRTEKEWVIDMRKKGYKFKYISK